MLSKLRDNQFHRLPARLLSYRRIRGDVPAVVVSSAAVNLSGIPAGATITKATPRLKMDLVVGQSSSFCIATAGLSKNLIYELCK